MLTLSQRVSYAKHCILVGRIGTRGFDNCFENCDGSYVIALLMRIARKDPEFYNAFRQAWGDINFDNGPLKCEAQASHLTDQELRKAAREHRTACLQKDELRTQELQAGKTHEEIDWFSPTDPIFGDKT